MFHSTRTFTTCPSELSWSSCPLAIALAHFPSPSVEDRPGEAVARFLSVELGEHPVGFVVDIGEEVQGLGNPAEIDDR